VAFMGVPSSSCWLSLTGPPVRTARTGSPPRVVTVAVSAWIFSEPWVMLTPCDSTVGWRSSSPPADAPASMSMAWLRSDDLAHAPGVSRNRVLAPARIAAARGLTSGRDIAMVDLGLERVLLAGQIQLQATAGQYRARPGDHDLTLGAGTPGIGVYRQFARGDLGARATRAGADPFHVALQAQFVAVGTDPAILRAHFPGIISRALARRNQEYRRGDVQRLL